ncbi:hypothetical protein BKA65DRAFT_144397 [Rhexocercosporidium sp. MPI-PUGE-AT-0058]|nr:hypothetical protein BKA65DRAFT_144397 [Rhexocercosporidium sp. MPI-PUGE-AT-0058]
MTRETQSGSDKIPAFANTMSGPDQASTSKGPLKGLEFLQTQMFGMLSTALQSQADELEDTWRARQVSKQNELQAALEDKENKLQVECATHRKTLTSLLALQRDAAKVRTKVAQLEQDLEDKVANAKAEDERVRVKIIQLERDLEEKVLLARNEGRQSMSDEILKDLDHTMEGERLALRRNHVEQLVKVRADSYELGVQAERKAAASEIVRPGLRHVTAEFENLKQQHKEELQLARKTGRESAYTELSLGPDERVNFMLQNHADLNSNRKIRELKTIYQNWDDIPQRVLPSFMLPEGHTPGDKTLYLLAKLSKEVDGAAACRLLQGEIDRRCKHSSNQSKCRIVTNSDVRNVLDRINPGSLDWPTSQGSMDQSQTPVLTPQDQGSSVPRTRDRSRERSKPQSKDLPKDSASEHPIQLTYEEMTDMFQVWQRNAFDLAVEQWVHVDRSSSPMAEECRSLNSNDSLLGKRFEVQSAAKLAGMTGKPYSTATELKILKQYLVDLTRELVGDDLYEAAEIVQTFKIIHSMFNHYNDLDLASKTKDTASAITLSANTPSRNLVMTSNRPVLGEAYNAPKRPTTDLSTPLFRDSKRCKTKITSSVSSLVQERQPSTRNSGPSLEISGSTIIVDSNARLGASAAVKKDEESEEDDLYSASPPPRVKKRGASKKGSGG